MKYPFFNTISKSKDYQTSFFGYNHTESCREGEFYDMKNLSSDLYPVLSTRKRRGIYRYPEGTGKYKANSLIAKDALCYISEGKFYINNNAVDDFEIPALYDEDGNERETTMVSMGAYVVFFPQNLYLNTVNTTDKGSLDSFFEAQKIDFTLAKPDGTAYEDLKTEKPTEGEDGKPPYQYYLDVSVTPNVLRQYSETSKAWVPVPTTYVKISSTGIGSRFSAGDGIKISGIENEDLSSLNGAHVIQSVGEDYITVIGIVSISVTLDLEGTDKNVSFERKAPEMDFVVESQNRLWGCKYGLVDGKTVNQIYASKLGDFKNWNCFAGIASDSYSVSVGSDGFFTGAITFQGSPIFFKENCLHKVFGSIPANYQIQTTDCSGVQKGSGRSLAIVNNTLFYKGNGGVFAYEGALPGFISDEFGSDRFENAVGGSLGNKYYISMMDSFTGKNVLFVYDTQKGLWHKEDNLLVKQFASDGTNLYYLSDDDKIHTIFGTNDPTDDKIQWYAETGIIGKNSSDKKTLKKVTARVKLPPGSRVLFFVEYDSFGGWQYLFSMEARTLQSFSVPIRINRCDHFRIRMEGIGEAQIHSISKTVQEGGDR